MTKVRQWGKIAAIGVLGLATGMFGFHSPPAEANAWSGSAAYYASGYGVGWWENTLALHSSWGNATSSWSYDPNGYYCVHPWYKPGSRLVVSSSAGTISCTVGDMVQVAHQGQWLSRWAIELNWNAFTALGLQHDNWVTVSEGWVASTTPVAEPVVEPQADYHPETGHWVIGDFREYWHEKGGLEVFGHPLGGMHYSEHHGMNVQMFERSRMEWHADCACVRLGLLGAEAQQ